MNETDLTPDCRSCAALCCVLLPFDAGPSFGFDKAAGEVCRHLGPGHRCTIHSDLARRGFAGCVAFDCLGAGQRATALFIDGPGWQGDSEKLARVEDGFRGLRQVHEALVLLHRAGALPLPTRVEAERLALIAALDAGRDWTADSLAEAAGREGVLVQVRRFITGLRGALG